MGLISVDTRNRKPIYEQLVDSIRQNVLESNFLPGEQLPSVRSLAVDLAINPNTIQKAYVELERQGIIYSLPGRGSFVSENISDIVNANKKDLLLSFEAALRELFSAGITKSELAALISEIWEESK